MVSTTSRSSCAATATSRRCGNGNAGASTIVGRGEARHVSPRARRRHLPIGPADEQAVDRQPVVVGVDATAAEVDVDAGGAVATRRRAGSPTARAAGARRCARRAARRRRPGSARNSRPLLAERHAGHADAGHERGAQRAGAQLERGVALEAPLDDVGGHGVGQTSSRFSTRRSPAAYCSSMPGLIAYSGMRRCHSRNVTRSSRRARCEPRHRCTPPPNVR